MNLIQSGAPTQLHVEPNSSSHQLAATSISHARLSHPGTLSPALMSANAQLALDQSETQSNGHHQLLALLTRNGIVDSTLHMESNQGEDAHYGQRVIVPGGEVANLNIRVRLNDQAQYDIVSVDLHLPSSGKTEAIFLSGIPAVGTLGNTAAIKAGTASNVSHLTAHYSRSQLADAMVRQNTTHSHLRAPASSGASASTRSTVFSHSGSAVGESVASSSRLSRTQVTQNSHNEPSPRQQSSSTAGSSGRQPATDDQIREHLCNPNGTLRTRQEIADAVNAAGLKVGVARIDSMRQEAGALPKRTRATDEEIRAQLRNADGTLRTQRGIGAALRATGSSASHSRIASQLHAGGGGKHMPGATDVQIRPHLRNPDGTRRTHGDVLRALHANGLGASNGRIFSLLQEIEGPRMRPSATDEQIRANLINPDGTLKTNRAVMNSLHAAGLGVSSGRVVSLLQDQRTIGSAN